MSASVGSHGGPIRVLIVDDSAVVRGLVSRALGAESEIEVAGTAMHGEAALTWMRQHPVDVVVMDVEMPVMDGLETLQRIQADFPHVRVVMASSLTYQGGETTIKALSMGAAGCIAKPQAGNLHESVRQLAGDLVPLVRELGAKQRSPAASTRSVSSVRQRRVPQRRKPQTAPQIVAIGASTGGPQALAQVLTNLPGDFPLPILIVQHMPAMFTPMLAEHIARDTGRPCREAVNGGVIQRGHTYVAPGDYHMVVSQSDEGMITRLNQSPQEHYCRPSVNPMLRSVAKWYGETALEVILTGMGEDGLEGTQEIVDAGGRVIAQDEASSTVWGMPGAVVEAELAHQVLPLTEIAGAIQNICLQEIPSR